jgi:uncharacterized protein (DUF58 family)
MPQLRDQRDDDYAAEVRAIEIQARRLVNDTLAGQYHAVFKGRGMSFDSVREYQPGDDVRTIDWNVTARSSSGAAFVKQYVEERELTVMLAVDLSASMDFGTRQIAKRKLAARIAAVLALSAVSNNDRVGLLLFSDRVEHFIPPKKGRAHVLRIVRDVLSTQPAGTTTRLDVACDYLAHVTRKRAVVFLLSDFLGSEASDERALGVLARRHDLVPVVVSDAAERQWPTLTGLAALEDAETGELVWFDVGDPKTLLRWAQRSAVAVRRRDDHFRKHGLEPIGAVVGEDYLPQLISFFRRRAARP